MSKITVLRLVGDLFWVQIPKLVSHTSVFKGQEMKEKEIINMIRETLKQQ